MADLNLEKRRDTDTIIIIIIFAVRLLAGGVGSAVWERVSGGSV